MEGRNVKNVKKYLQENPDALAVSIYEKLEPGILCSFPIDDAVLYAEKITCNELLPYMEPEYNNFHWSLIWAKIKKGRE